MHAHEYRLLGASCYCKQTRVVMGVSMVKRSTSLNILTFSLESYVEKGVFKLISYKTNLITKQMIFTLEIIFKSMGSSFIEQLKYSNSPKGCNDEMRHPLEGQFQLPCTCQCLIAHKEKNRPSLDSPQY